jgi:hypothetical protein
MLTAEDNEILTRVGPGTLMGNLLRRYYDRTQEHLGTTDRAVIRMHELLLNAAKGLAQGKEPPALTGEFRSIRAAEKILESGEDWGYLGTDDDPLVQKYELAVRER